jgi:hypothetical protein
LIKAIWPDIGQMLVDSFNEAYYHGKLSISQRQAVITLIEKKGKDRIFIKNWHPISLLNCDYKMASKALATRLKPLLPKIIYTDQTGFVKDRNITDSIRTILDICSYAEKKQMPGLLVCLNFQMAFNTL